MDSRVLADLLPRSRAVVRHVAGPTALRRRLMEMGLVPGTVVEVQRPAPLGDPMKLRVRHYTLSVRRKDARFVSVEQVVI